MPILDLNLKALMNLTVVWEKYTGRNGHGDPSYAAPKTLTCWMEERGVGGGIEAYRRSDEDVYDARIDVYLDATDTDVASMGMTDRFTIPSGLESTDTGMTSMPSRMTVFCGPNGDPWVKLVTL